MRAPVTPVKKTPTKLFTLLSTPQPSHANDHATMREGEAPPIATTEATDVGIASTSAVPTPSEPPAGRPSKRAAKNK